jgi:hypothetical protein
MNIGFLTQLNEGIADLERQILNVRSNEDAKLLMVMRDILSQVRGELVRSYNEIATLRRDLLKQRCDVYVTDKLTPEEEANVEEAFNEYMEIELEQLRRAVIAFDALKPRDLSITFGEQLTRRGKALERIVEAARSMVYSTDNETHTFRRKRT